MFSINPAIYKLVPAASTPEAMAASVKNDLPRFSALVKKIGIKPE